MTEIIHWKNPETFREIMNAYDHLIENGWIEPPVRTLIYQLNGENPERWTKDRYNQLTRFLQQKKDSNELKYGLFSGSTGGADEIPMSKIEILKQIQNWKEAIPLQLSPDGNLYLLFHEHEGMIPTLNKLFDYHIGSFSSQGQIRHEHLYRVLSSAVKSLHRLKGNKIKILGIADYDIYGAKNVEDGQGHIIRNHADWIQRTFPDCEFYLYGVTRDQIIESGLNPMEEHQFDGWLQRYGLQQFREDLRSSVGFNGDWKAMKQTKIVCNSHSNFQISDINSGLSLLMHHLFEVHGESWQDMDLTLYFKEIPEEE